jgi:hemerythrin-like domain-containing protein
MKFDNFYDAWWYLNTTDVFWHKNLEPSACRDDEGNLYSNEFRRCLDIDVQKVNPETCSIDDDESKNTKVEIWLECGEPYTYKELDAPGWFKEESDLDEVRYSSHNTDYDCGGNTFEEAIVNLANIVWEKNER